MEYISWHIPRAAARLTERSVTLYGHESRDPDYET